MFQGDNTQAFGGNFLQIYLTAEDVNGNEIPLPPIDKVIVRVGSVVKYYDPAPIIDVNFTEEETATFSTYNTLYVATYDELKRKQTPVGSFVFSTCPRRV